MIFFPTLSDFGLILEANIHVLTGETSCFLRQPNSTDSKMTQQLGLSDKRKWQMSRERCSWGNISSQFSHGSWRLFFLFLFFLFFLFLLLWLQERALFMDGWLISVHFEREEGSWRIREKTIMMWEVRESWAVRVAYGLQSWPSSQWSGLGKLPGHWHPKLGTCVLVQGWHQGFFQHLVLGNL